MRILVLGRGKTGSLVADLARERGHMVSVLGSEASMSHAGGSVLAGALLPSALLVGALKERPDAIIDFTTPEAVAGNLRTCLEAGACVVVGTTGWYQDLPALSALAQQRGASLLYGTNFSVGVQAFFRAARTLAEALPGYRFQIREVHHVAKKDAPSGTALTLKRLLDDILPEAKIAVTSEREGDVAGLHVLEVVSENDRITLQHEAHSRRGFAEGAVQAAEWLAKQKPGVWDFSEVADRLAGPAE